MKHKERKRTSVVSVSDIEPEELSRALRKNNLNTSRQRFEGSFLLRGDHRSGADVIVDSAGVRRVADLPDDRLRPQAPELAQLRRNPFKIKDPKFEAAYEQIRRERMLSAPLVYADTLQEEPCALLSIERRITTKGHDNHIRMMIVERGKGGRINLHQRLMNVIELLPGGTRTAPIGWHEDIRTLDQLQDMSPPALLEELALAVQGHLGHRSRILASTLARHESSGTLRVAWGISQSDPLISEVILASHPVWPELPGELQRDVLQGILKGQSIGPLLQSAATRMLEVRAGTSPAPRCPVWRTPFETWSHSETYRNHCAQMGITAETWDPRTGAQTFEPPIKAPVRHVKRRKEKKLKQEQKTQKEGKIKNSG